MRRLINDTIADRPADMTVCMHLCRGNFAGAWVAEGGYEPIAELLFNEIDVDGYFLEYDSARAGGFEPLRFLPKGKIAVLGLVTTKSGAAREQGRAQAPHRRGGAATPRSSSSRSARNAASPAASAATPWTSRARSPSFAWWSRPRARSGDTHSVDCVLRGAIAARTRCDYCPQHEAIMVGVVNVLAVALTLAAVAVGGRPVPQARNLALHRAVSCRLAGARPAAALPARADQRRQARPRGPVPWYDGLAALLAGAGALYIAIRFPALSELVHALPWDGLIVAAA